MDQLIYATSHPIDHKFQYGKYQIFQSKIKEKPSVFIVPMLSGC